MINKSNHTFEKIVVLIIVVGIIAGVIDHYNIKPTMSTDTPYSVGFRTPNETQQCYSITDGSKKMECLGFKELK